jgi:divalent metal cation (Fe/Co/Zn/Cd) transporter
MNKALSIALLVVGVLLLVFGLNASHSAVSNVSNTLTGSPTDKSIWLIVLGAAGIVIGGVGLMFGRSRE